MPVRVLVAESAARVRFALGVLLRRRADMDLVGEATSTTDLMRKVRQAKPDVILLDWRLQVGSTAGCLQAVRACRPEAFVIVLSDRPEARPHALAAGADAFVSKVDPPERLIAAIEASRAPRQARRAEHVD